VTAVNWDEPSSGVVNDAKPALALRNHTGPALVAESEGTAVRAMSGKGQAVTGSTLDTLSARFISNESFGVFGLAPEAAGVVGANRSDNLAGTIGASSADPALPPVQSPGGAGVLGVTDRFDATGVLGLATGGRSVGVHGEAIDGVGVQGVGTSYGVEGHGDPGVIGFTHADASAGVAGVATGLAAGVRAQADGGPGVDARSQAGTAVQGVSQGAHGVRGEAHAMNAAGVLGVNDDAGGTGVDGYSDAGIAVHAHSSHGTAMYAESMFGTALHAENPFAQTPAIEAQSLVGTALEAQTINGIGVDAFGNTGVAGGSLANPDPSDPRVGSGTFGYSNLGAGVYGASLGGVGIEGLASQVGWAGLFHGDVFVEGTLFKFVSLFSIDHPLDPERKVLRHAGVESNEYKTFYDGVAQLDRRGTARIRLPRWFEALNRDIRYQLTPLGEAAPNLHVTEEVRNNAFAIGGGRPHQRVCWQVTGIRHDRWAEANPLQVEAAKKRDLKAAAKPDLERLKASLSKRAAQLRRDSSARKKAARARQRPADIPKPPPIEAPTTVPTRGQVAEQAHTAVKHLSSEP
jgi:hypothetical protein